MTVLTEARRLVVWHELECGAYDTDLPLWRELAVAGDGPLLDVGAGTGRVSLHLAAAGHAVTALDLEGELLAALRRRAQRLDLRVLTITADARAFAAHATDGGPYATIIVPMQTLQLLGGPLGRARFLRTARAHLRPGGILAAALANAAEAFDEEHDQPPKPDTKEVDGIVFCSRPVAVREHEHTLSIERIRETIDRAGRRTVEGDVIHLDRVTAAQVAREATALGFTPLTPRTIAATDEYVGSTVVMLRG